ncbi:hypothetical protein ACFE04_021056 [Oxalis oulophora]
MLLQWENSKKHRCVKVKQEHNLIDNNGNKLATTDTLPKKKFTSGFKKELPSPQQPTRHYNKAIVRQLLTDLKEVDEVNKHHAQMSGVVLYSAVNWVEGRGKSSHSFFSLSARSPALLAPPEWQLGSSLNSKDFDFMDCDFVSSSIANEIAISTKKKLKDKHSGRHDKDNNIVPVGMAILIEYLSIMLLIVRPSWCAECCSRVARCLCPMADSSLTPESLTTPCSNLSVS